MGKSEEQQNRLVDKAYDELNFIMRLMEGHANPKENFCPFVRKNGRIVGMNRDDYYIKQVARPAEVEPVLHVDADDACCFLCCVTVVGCG